MKLKRFIEGSLGKEMVNSNEFILGAAIWLMVLVVTVKDAIFYGRWGPVGLILIIGVILLAALELWENTIKPARNRSRE